MADVTQRFSSRVDNYIRYRPGYPLAILDTLAAECGLTTQSEIADIGSGTGLLAQLFLDRGNRVLAIEPNREMREAGERLLATRANFVSIDGRAEATTLPRASVDLVVAGQAFHWFDRPAARREFARILRPGGYVVLIWNERLVDATPFLAEYEQLLKEFATDYTQIDHRNIDGAVLKEFYAPREYRERVFPNVQTFDFAGLRGRLLSSSYAPENGDPRHEPMLARLRQIFDRHQQSGKVNFEYATRMYFGQLA